MEWPNDEPRKCECIEFARNMDYALGRAFSLAWRVSKSIEEETERFNRIHWYIRDAIVYRPSQAHKVMGEILIRKLSDMADQFDEDVLLLHVAIIKAACGDYDLLLAYAKEAEIFPPEAHKLHFGED